MNVTQGTQKIRIIVAFTFMKIKAIREAIKRNIFPQTGSARKFRWSRSVDWI